MKLIIPASLTRQHCSKTCHDRAITPALRTLDVSESAAPQWHIKQEHVLLGPTKDENLL